LEFLCDYLSVTLWLNDNNAKQMNQKIFELWPELEWIGDSDLREKTAKTWEIALDRSELSANDLGRIPFTLLVKDLDVSFMDHKRCVVHIARECGYKIKEFPINWTCDRDSRLSPTRSSRRVLSELATIKRTINSP